jgi:hypothetical protein
MHKTQQLDALVHIMNYADNVFEDFINSVLTSCKNIV